MSGKIIVLLVDDDEGILEAIHHILLDEEGIELLTALDSIQAKKILGQSPVDIIIADYDMPGENGLELIEEVRKNTPDIVRVLLSGKVDLHDVTKSFNEGLISFFIIKPWQDNEEVVTTVRSSIRMRQALLKSRQLVEQYQLLKEQLDKLGRSVMANYLALRQDLIVAQDTEFLRRLLENSSWRV